jgi:SOS-response transcriptional repressor LexA
MPVEMGGRYSWMVVDPMPAETEEVEIPGVEREKLMEDALPVIRPGDYFATVEGDSMTEAGLGHGQSVVIRPGAMVHEGDICAVWIEGESGGAGQSMIRRVYSGTDLVRLVPASPHHRSAVYPAGRVRVQGVVVATLATQIFRR